MQEIWKDVVGYEGLYMVSNFGYVKSMAKEWVCNKGKRVKPETIMRMAIDTSGYYQCWLSNGSGKPKNMLVHRLVAMAFLENIYNKNDVNHKNGIKSDNRVENLEWVTRSENIIHAFENNLIIPAKGSRHGMSILDEDDVLKIRELSKKYTKIELARMFGIGRRSINNIVNRKSWKHI
jgi:hypothetical protein